VGKVKWYVNLDADLTVKRQGDAVPIVASAAGPDGDVAWIAKWSVEPDGGSNTDKKYLSGDARARTLDRFGLSEDSKFTTWLKLPHVGGDSYKVKCAKPSGASAKESDAYETWRKIYISVHYMNDACLALFNRLKPGIEKVFKDAFVELVWFPAPVRTLVDEPNTSGEIVQMPHLYDAAKTPLAWKPFHLRLVIVNDAYDPIDGAYDRQNVDVYQLRIDTNQPLDDTRGTHGCKRALARYDPSKPEIDVTALATKVGEKALEFDFSKDAQLKRALDDGKTLDVVVTTHERSHGYCGYSCGNFVCIKRVGASDTSLLQTFTHEVGHAFQQAVRYENLYDDGGSKTGTEENERWHDDVYGGQGPHCYFNCTKDEVKKRIKPTAGQDLCTMFYADHPKVYADGRFCERCLPRLKRVPLNRKAVLAKHWDQYP
jgi:hypothetical protein